MRIFLQAQDESIVINDDITVTVLKIEGDEILLEIDAPPWLSIEEQSAAPSRRVQKAGSLPAR